MKLAWLVVVALGGSAMAETQAEVAAKANQEGVDLMTKSKYPEAAAKFRDAIARAPEAKYFFNLCSALVPAGKLADALTACNEVGKYKPDQALKEKTDKLIEQIKAPKAEPAVTPEEAALADKLNEEGKSQLNDQGDSEGAADKFRAATKHDPQAKYFLNLEIAEYHSGRYQAAIDAYKEVSPHHAPDDLQQKADKVAAMIREEARHRNLKLN
jgi:tetratricopeptide (TPR) repeat protein